MAYQRLVSGGGKGGRGFGRTRFISLEDTPQSYTGAGGKIVTVKADESGVEFKSESDLDAFTVKVTSADDTPQHLNDKLVVGTGLAKVVLNPSDTETLQFSLDAALDALNNVEAATPNAGQVLTYNGSNWTPQDIPTGSSKGAEFFFDDTASGIPTYNSLLTSPGAGAEVVDTITVNNTEGDKLIESYVSSALNKTSLEGGVWTFNIWGALSIITGTTQFVIKVYKRTSGGSETLLFSVDSADINSTTPVENSITTIQQAFAGLNLTDLLVVKMYAKTTSAVNVTVNFYHNGTTRYSHISTPFEVVHAIGGGTHTPDTIANLKSKVSDGSLITTAANEFDSLTEKTSLVAADRILCENSASGDAKNFVQWGNMKPMDTYRMVQKAELFQGRSDFAQVYSTVTINLKTYYGMQFRKTNTDILLCHFPVGSYKWDKALVNVRLWHFHSVAAGANNVVRLYTKIFHVPEGAGLDFDSSGSDYAVSHTLDATDDLENTLFEGCTVDVPEGTADTEGWLVVKFVRDKDNVADTYADIIYAPYVSLTIFLTGGAA